MLYDYIYGITGDQDASAGFIQLLIHMDISINTLSAAVGIYKRIKRSKYICNKGTDYMVKYTNDNAVNDNKILGDAVNNHNSMNIALNDNMDITSDNDMNITLNNSTNTTLNNSTNIKSNKSTNTKSNKSTNTTLNNILNYTPDNIMYKRIKTNQIYYTKLNALNLNSPKPTDYSVSRYKSILYLNEIMNNTYLLLTICCLVAHKYNNDMPYSNDAWACATGTDIKYLNKMERQLLYLLGYCINDESTEKVINEIRPYIKDENNIKWRVENTYRKTVKKNMLKKMFCILK